MDRFLYISSIVIALAGLGLAVAAFIVSDYLTIATGLLIVYTGIITAIAARMRLTDG